MTKLSVCELIIHPAPIRKNFQPSERRFFAKERSTSEKRGRSHDLREPNSQSALVIFVSNPKPEQPSTSQGSPPRNEITARMATRLARLPAMFQRLASAFSWCAASTRLVMSSGKFRAKIDNEIRSAGTISARESDD